MDEQQRKEWLTIGDFGRQTQLSRKALRLYDERGLLVPDHVDPQTGYRYYTQEQTHLARRIRLLRLMEMPLEKMALVLSAWNVDRPAALHQMNSHIRALEKQLEAVQLAARLLRQELMPMQEKPMSFTFTPQEAPSQMIVSIRRNITVPAYHKWVMPAMRQLWDHIKESGAQSAGDPLALYYGPVNEEDDGPVEIGVPFTGSVPPKGEMKIRELPAHKAICVKTYGKYNEYPGVLEMWNALTRFVQEQGLESNWDQDMTTYEIWHEDLTMTLGWPVRNFPNGELK